MISTRHLSLGFNNTCIAADISLDIQPGEFIGIFGANGSGKTTFLKTILGLLPPLQGSITFLGQAPQFGQSKIGYMPQYRSHTSLHFNSRTIILAALQGTQMGMPWASVAQKKMVDEVLHWVDATAFADRPFYQLSGGERQRIYLAQALLHYPPLLLLDEPLAGLDPHYQELFMQILRRIQQEFNTTILLTAHDPNPLLKVMNRVLYFANKKVALGSIDEVMTSEQLSALYETPIEVIHYRDRMIVLGECLEGHHD